jgi:CHAD domain-containing protein
MIPNTLKAIEEKIEAINVLRDGLDEIFIYLNEKRKELISNGLNNVLDNLTPEKFMAIRDLNSLTSEAYDKMRKWFSDNYDKRGLKRGGYNIKTGQTVLEICLDQNIPLTKQLGILDFLPYIEPCKFRESEDLHCYIDIFEHTLSEHASYSLRTNPEKTRFWVQSHYGHIYSESTDLIKAMTYIYEHMYYKAKT